MARTLKQMLGKHVLASLTEIDANGRIMRRQEFYGTLIEKDGKPALLPSDSTHPFTLPNNLDYYYPVDPQLEYQLADSGKIVSGIDYTLSFVKGPPEFFNTAH